MINAATSNAATSNAAVAESVAAGGNTADPSALANAAATAAQAEWQAHFCARFATLLFEYGRWFLLAALITGTIGAIAAIVKLFTTKPEDEQEAGGGLLSDSVAALTALIDSLAKAPTWIAMLGAALALLWMSGHAQPTFCDSCGNSTGNEIAAANESSASDRDAVNESDGDAESGG